MAMRTTTKVRKLIQQLQWMTDHFKDKDYPEAALWKIDTAWDLIKSAQNDIWKVGREEWLAEERANRKLNREFEEALEREEPVLSVVHLDTVETIEGNFYDDDDEDDDD